MQPIIRIHGKDPQIDFGLKQLFGKTPNAPLSICNLQTEEGRAALDASGVAASVTDQGYQLAQLDTGEYVLAGGASGLMYGLIDLGHALNCGAPLPLGKHEPRFQYRGIKFNIPLDARTPSYSDASDSAWNNIPHMWEMDFWRDLIDALARDKYNLISLWNLHPFPSMVRVPGYERVALEDVKRTPEPVYGASLMGYGMYGKKYAGSLVTVKKMSMDEKIQFWRSVMLYGRERGVYFTVMTWNVFIYGTEHTDYGIDDRLDNPVTRDYFRRSVAALIDTYPLLMGVGVTAGERMSVGRMPQTDIAGDVKWLAQTYGQGVKDALEDSDRPFMFIHRQHMSGVEEILKAFENLPCPICLSGKYSQAHMYSSVQPHFSDSLFRSLPDGVKTFLTLRDDDMYMLRWGGVEFARAYIENIPRGPVIGFMMGPDGYTIGRDYLEKRDGKHPLVFERQWLRNAIWGRLAYEPSLPEEHFIQLIALRCGCGMDKARQIYGACALLSQVIPLVNQVHWHDFDFQNYPELNCGVDHYHSAMHVGTRMYYHDLNDYLLAPAQPGCGFLSISEACRLELLGQNPPQGAVLPDQVIKRLGGIAAQAQAMLDGFEGGCPELCALAEDLRDTALLGRFFADKLECALTAQRVYSGLMPGGAQRAIDLAQSACDIYTEYARRLAQRYYPQRLSRMNGRMVDPLALCEQARLDVENTRMIMEAFL